MPMQGLSARYEEWNTLYGSGTDSKRREGSRNRSMHYTMYV